jgi:hypothetical protein
MKKNLWVLLALSALIAMFVIAGCAPKPSPTPTPTPTVVPTEAPDTKCPEVVSTDVYKYYGEICNTCYQNNNNIDQTLNGKIYICKAGETPLFKIVITFDENIDTLASSCIFDPTNWTIKVKNNERFSKEAIANAIVVEASGKQIVITAQAYETGQLLNVYSFPAGGYINMDEFLYCGLICSKVDAQKYADEINTYGGSILSGPLYIGLFNAPTIADLVTWSTGCLISDELGNYCCSFKGEDCCLEPICEDCGEGCPFGSSTCL